MSRSGRQFLFGLDVRSATSALGHFLSRTSSRLRCETQLQPLDDIRSCIFIFTHHRDRLCKSNGQLVQVPDVVTDEVPCPWFATETDSKAPDAVPFYLVTSTRRDVYRSTKPAPNSGCLIEQHTGLQPFQSTRNRCCEASRAMTAVLHGRGSAAVWCPTTYQIFVKANLSPLFSVPKPCQ